MAAVPRPLISTPSFVCRCSDPESSSASVVSASSSSFQHLIGLPQKGFLRLLPELSCSHGFSTSSHSGLSLRFLKRNSRQASSPSPLSTLSSLEKPVIVEPVSHFLFRNLGALSAGSLVLSTAGAVLAETIDVTALPSPTEGTQTDYVLSVLFIAAFIGLAIVTAGVIYLGVTEFLENRQRTAMQKAAGEEKIEKREKSGVAKVGSGKGFGVKKFEKKTEKGE